MSDTEYNNLLIRYEELLNTNKRQRKQLALLERSREDLRKEIKRLQDIIKLLDNRDDDVYLKEYDDYEDEDGITKEEYGNWWD